MAVTAAQRLMDALATVPRRAIPALAKRAGVTVREVQRAATGTLLYPREYLRLCAALGIKSTTGERIEPRRIGDFDPALFGLGVEMTRRICRHRTMRGAVEAIGRPVTLSMMSRVENGKRISISGVIAICRWIGTEPEQYCADPDAPKIHVKPKNETRERAAV